VSKKLWGSEEWLLSAHPAGRSEPPLPADYPLLVKVIQADADLSVQVHPYDEYAAAHEHSRGKTEAWYVTAAKPGAAVIAGLTGEYAPEELRAAIAENRLEPYLRRITVAPGDLVYLPAGLVHALTGGIRVVEVQQSSDVTYRLYDWGRGRECHVDKALQVVQPLLPTVIRGFPGKFICPYFALQYCATPEYFRPPEQDYAIVTLTGGARGEAAFLCAPGEKPALNKGQSFLAITPRGNTDSNVD
jgi:mannose-6-phosphate isomerase